MPENSHSFARAFPPGFAPGEPDYEPDHLRHRPGDTWEIGGRPADPDDTGAFGTPGWRPDTRIGRHRRGELPDPLPASPEPSIEPDRPSPRPRPRSWPDEPYRFSKLREDAWDRFLVDSEPLANAHTTGSAAERECGRTIGTLIRVVRWIISVLKGSDPALEPDDEDPASLRRVPPNPRPQTDPSYIGAWEARFDDLYPVTGGASL
ncbi:hypothetical protein L0U85_13395 [Glycomyces sp. L485]|uniref:hypothetical protein n=1 Tax=Glycomyces sp. L485 TaxID=2909235 RepID=UPI001F4A18BA|nr:hypothetical protein [Glycomyces sp. L485]MCH7231840.1 hypothetical protein [Glycomyces sp. L485]